MQRLAEEKAETEAAWNVMFAAYCQEYPEMEALWDQYYGDTDVACKGTYGGRRLLGRTARRPEATSNLSGKIINKLKDQHAEPDRRLC